jgi:hypothetical protein
VTLEEERDENSLETIEAYLAGQASPVEMGWNLV